MFAPGSDGITQQLRSATEERKKRQAQVASAKERAQAHLSDAHQELEQEDQEENDRQGLKDLLKDKIRLLDQLAQPAARKALAVPLRSTIVLAMKLAYWASLLSAMLIGAAWFVYKGGGPLCDPTHTTWLLSGGDRSWHYLGWLFYQRDAWHIPLGRIASYPDPVGTAVAYTDSIPWLALLLKLLWRPALQDYQYFGPWLAFCFAMQGLWGARLVALVTPRPLLQGLGALLYAAAPVLLFRIGHMALCAQWLLLAMLWLYLRPCPDADAMRRALRGAALVLAVAAGVHAYLMVMAFCMAAALLWRLWRYDRLLGGRRALGLGAAFLGLITAVLALIGYFDGTGPVAGGNGRFSADLLTLINPQGSSTLLPTLPTGLGQYEGFAYLGAGGLGLVGLAAFWLLTRRVRWEGQRMLPLAVVALGFAAYAFSTYPTVGGKALLAGDFTFFGLARVFHASGRFIWPLYYLLLTCALSCVLKRWQRRPLLAHGALALLLFVQLYEQRLVKIGLTPAAVAVPASPEWNLAKGGYRTLVLYPPALDCEPSYPDGHVVALGYLAHRLGMTINSATLARRPSLREQAYCRTLRNEVEQHALRRDAIYIVDAQALSWFSDAACGQLDGYHVCVSAQQQDSFRTFLSPPKP